MSTTPRYVAGLLALLVALSAPPVAAQQNVTFIEGLGDSPDVWNGYRADLRQRYVINDVAASWDDANRTGIPDIANQLYPFVPSNSVVIGHSTGGAIAREMIRTRGTGRVSKLITIGTSHLGAPIVPLARANAGRLVSYWAGDLVYPWALLIGGQAGSRVVSSVVNDLVRPAGDFAIARSGLLDGVVERDLTPNSSFLNTLNANPAATLPSTGAYAVFGAEDWMTHFRILESATESDRLEEGNLVRYAVGVRNAYAGIGAAVYSYASYLDYRYRQTGDIGYQIAAAYYANAAFAFWWGAYAINTVWQNDYSLAILGNNQFGNRAGDDDGLLPIGSQAPGFFDLNHRLRAAGANHLEETSGPAALARIQFAFSRDDIDVPLRNTGGGSGPGDPPPGPDPSEPCPGTNQLDCSPTTY